MKPCHGLFGRAEPRQSLPLLEMLGPDVCTAGQDVHGGPAPWLPWGLIAGNTGIPPRKAHPLENPWDSADPCSLHALFSQALVPGAQEDTECD